MFSKSFLVDSRQENIGAAANKVYEYRVMCTIQISTMADNREVDPWCGKVYNKHIKMIIILIIY